MLSSVFLLIAYVRALAAMVAVAVFVGCGTPLATVITVSVPRPAAINVKEFDTIALGRIEGETSGIFSTELRQAISKSGQFEVLSSEALALERMESNEATSKTALVSGSISVDYEEDHSTSTSDETTTYRTDGRATVTASLSIVDMHTSEVLIVKEFKGFTSDYETSTGSDPNLDDAGRSLFDVIGLLGGLFLAAGRSYPDLDKGALFAECRRKIIRSFMFTVVPYTEHVRVSFETDGKMPELERGFKKVETGDWDAAIDLFRRATETYSNSDRVHKAYYNLGVGYLYTDQFGQARMALEEAYGRKAEKNYREAVEQLDVRIEDTQRLEEQGRIERAVVIVPPQPSTARGNDLESWYIHCGLGLGHGNNTYPYGDDIEGDSLDGDSLDEYQAWDLGLYLPRGNRTLVGVAFSARPLTLTADSSLSHSLLAVSAMHFVTDRIGQGPFVRADVGFTEEEAQVRRVRTASDWGVGFLLGGGYGIPVTSGTRVLLNANFSLRRIKGEQSGSIGITLNGLF